MGPPRTTTALPTPDAPSVLPEFAERDDAARALRRRDPDATSRTSTSTSRSRFWRLACILEGVYSRMLTGAQGDTSVDPEVFRHRVEDNVELAEEHAARFAGRR